MALKKYNEKRGCYVIDLDQSINDCLGALNVDTDNFQFILEKNRTTEVLLKYLERLAVTSKYDLITALPKELFTREVVDKLISIDSSFNMFACLPEEFLSDENQMAFIRKNEYNFRRLEHPSDKVCKYIISINPFFIFDIAEERREKLFPNILEIYKKALKNGSSTSFKKLPEEYKEKCYTSLVYGDYKNLELIPHHTIDIIDSAVLGFRDQDWCAIHTSGYDKIYDLIKFDDNLTYEAIFERSLVKEDYRYFLACSTPPEEYNNNMIKIVLRDTQYYLPIAHEIADRLDFEDWVNLFKWYGKHEDDWRASGDRDKWLKLIPKRFVTYEFVHAIIAGFSTWDMNLMKGTVFENSDLFDKEFYNSFINGVNTEYTENFLDRIPSSCLTNENIITMLKSKKLRGNIPDYIVTESLLRMCLENGIEYDTIQDMIKKSDLDKKSIYLALLNEDLRFITCKKATSYYPNLFDLALFTIKSPYALKLIVENYSESIYADYIISAVNLNGMMIRYVPEKFRTRELYETAVKQNINALEYINNEELIRKYS